MSELDAILADAIRANLPDHAAELNLAEARKLAAAAWARTRDDAIEHVANRLAAESEERIRQREREQERERRTEREWAETVKKAKKSWELHWGPEIAEQLDPEATYWLLRADQSLYAFASREAVAEARGALEPTHRVEIVGARNRLSAVRPPDGGVSPLDADEGIAAVELGGEKGAGRLNLPLVGVEPDSQQLAAIARGKQEALDAKSAAEAEADRKRREREREERKFGVSVSE
jgi:hypothetical protein